MTSLGKVLSGQPPLVNFILEPNTNDERGLLSLAPAQLHRCNPTWSCLGINAAVSHRPVSSTPGSRGSFVSGKRCTGPDVSVLCDSATGRAGGDSWPVVGTSSPPDGGSALVTGPRC